MHDEKEQDWSKIVALLYTDKRWESMLVLAPGEFNDLSITGRARTECVCRQRDIQTDIQTYRPAASMIMHDTEILQPLSSFPNAKLKDIY